MADINPFRYRTYYYDNETWFYYLQSRYYDPAIGRFINADDIAYLGADGTPLSCNLFAYCLNNPVRRKDISGTASIDILDDPNGNNIPDEREYSGTGNSGPSGQNGNTVRGGQTSGVKGSASASTQTGSSGSTGYSYSAPPGGGGTTSSVQVGDTKVSFGHGGRHIDSSDISGLESAIANDVVTRPPTTGKALSVPIVYGGVDFTYRYFTLSNTHINVGTYFYTVLK